MRGGSCRSPSSCWSARGTAKALSYFERIGRGEPWEAAFAAAFGKSVDAFYAEFAAYRRVP
jgi:hypothetical protein